MKNVFKILILLFVLTSTALAQPVSGNSVKVTSSALPTGASTSAKQDTIIGHVDGLEALATSLNGYVDGVEALITSTNGYVDGLEGYVDGIESVLGTIDTDTGNIATSIASIDSKITAVNTGAVVVSSGSLTCNAGTNLNTSGLALETGGNLAATAAMAGTEDAASADGHTGAKALFVRQDTPANTSNNDGDYEFPKMSAGRVWTSAKIDTALPAGTNAIGKLAANSGVDIGDVDVTSIAAGNNNIGDVDVASSALPSGAATSANQVTEQGYVDGLETLIGTTNTNTGNIVTSVQLIDDAVATTASAIPSKGLAISGTDGTNARVVKTDSSGELQIDVLTMPTTTVTGTVTASNTAGDVAHDGGDSGNPVKTGSKAASSLPTAVSSGDRTNDISDLWGRKLIAHIDPAMQTWKSFNATSAQTGIDVWSPTSGKRIAVTSFQVSVYATTACRVILWFGDNADTTYTEGTDQALFKGSFAPSSSSKPGALPPLLTPAFCTTADRELHITTDAACSVDVVVYGYEF